MPKDIRSEMKTRELIQDIEKRIKDPDCPESVRKDLESDLRSLKKLLTNTEEIYHM
jgi:ATP-dependent Lon protease